MNLAAYGIRSAVVMMSRITLTVIKVMFTRRKCVYFLKISMVYPKKKKSWVILHGYSRSWKIKYNIHCSAILYTCHLLNTKVMKWKVLTPINFCCNKTVTTTSALYLEERKFCSERNLGKTLLKVIYLRLFWMKWIKILLSLICSLRLQIIMNKWTWKLNMKVVDSFILKSCADHNSNVMQIIGLQSFFKCSDRNLIRPSRFFLSML